MIWTAITFVIANAAKIAFVTLGAAALVVVVYRWYAGMRLADILKKYEDELYK